MGREIPKRIKLAAIEMASGIVALATAAVGYPVIAAAIVALALACLVADRIRCRSAATGLAAQARDTGAGAAPPAHNPAERQAFIEQLQLRLEAAQRTSEPLTLAVVTPRVPLDMEPSVRDAAVEHIRGSIDRITRATDHWGPLGDGRFGVVLANCIEEHAASYGERLSLAIANRPLLAQGRRIEALAVTVPSFFDANQFYGAADFLSAAELRASKEPISSHHLVADTRLLRQRFYGKDYGVRAA